MVDNEEDMETEALEGVDPANYVPRNNTKHKLLRTSSNEVPSHDTSGDNAVWGQGQGQGCRCGHGCGNQSTS